MPNKEKMIDALFEQEIKKDSPGAAVAVIKDGSVIYKNGYGIACMDYDIPITPSTIFNVASVSKQFTAFVIALLADQGKLSLDDDIRKYLPEIYDFGKTITIRHLIHHTSGLRDQWELLMMAGWRIDDVITNEHILKIVRHQRELNFDPGEEYMYCNTGYTLMGEIVARVSGQSFREFTAKNIFEPLGMNNTHFHNDHEMIVRNMAYSYDLDGNNGFKKIIWSFANVGATSLFTTVEDLAKWLDNFDKKTVGGETVINQMLQKGKLNNGTELDYAFALVFGKYRELDNFGHGGMDAGYRSHIIFFPDQKFGVVVLSNLGSFSPYDLAMRVADIYLADQLAHMVEVKEETAMQQPEKTYSTTLDEYVGSYYSDELGTEYTMVIKDDKLVRQHRRLDDVILTCVDKDIFNGHPISNLTFTRDESNNIIGFKLTGNGRARNLRFNKRSI
jgi:CubicO group peptidase (beta-lactamase class C family)